MQRKIRLTIFSVWALLNIATLLIGLQERNGKFYDFNGHADVAAFLFPLYPDIRTYDLTEFFFYILFPLMIYYVVKGIRTLV